jgi:hypothetical protein
VAKKPTGDRELASDDEMDMMLTEGEIEVEVEDDGPFKPMDDDEIEAIVSSAVDDAIDFISSDIADLRIKSQRYFDGEVDIGEEEGRSTVVATKCRDTVRAVKPSIQRVFMTSERPVEFVPSPAWSRPAPTPPPNSARTTGIKSCAT